MSKYYTSGAATTPSSFVAFPKKLFQPKFDEVSIEAKMLYSILLDRVSLSIKNNLIDTLGRAYIIFKQSELARLFGCAEKKIQKLFKELESLQLVERKKQGCNLPDLIFVKKIDDDGLTTEQTGNTNNDETDSKSTEKTGEPKRFSGCKATRQNGIPGQAKKTSPGQVKMTDLNKTEHTNTDLNETRSINQDTELPKNIAILNKQKRLMDLESAQAKVKSQIDYDALYVNIDNNDDRFILDTVVKVMSDVFSWHDGKISINKYPTGYTQLREKFSKLNMFHIEYVMECVANRKGLAAIKNIKSYLATALFNAPDSIDWYYSQQVKANQNKNFIPTNQDLNFLME